MFAKPSKIKQRGFEKKAYFRFPRISSP